MSRSQERCGQSPRSALAHDQCSPLQCFPPVSTSVHSLQAAPLRRAIIRYELWLSHKAASCKYILTQHWLSGILHLLEEGGINLGHVVISHASILQRAVQKSVAQTGYSSGGFMSDVEASCLCLPLCAKNELLPGDVKRSLKRSVPGTGEAGDGYPAAVVCTSSLGTARRTAQNAQRSTYYMGGCQNYGPFLGTLNSRCRIIMGTQKGTIMLTTTHMTGSIVAPCLSALGFVTLLLPAR